MQGRRKGQLPQTQLDFLIFMQVLNSIVFTTSQILGNAYTTSIIRNDENKTTFFTIDIFFISETKAMNFIINKVLKINPNETK